MRISKILRGQSSPWKQSVQEGMSGLPITKLKLWFSSTPKKTWLILGAGLELGGGAALEPPPPQLS